MRDYRFFEKWARAHKMKPVCRVVERNGDVLIADSGDIILEGDRMFYRTAFAIERDQAWLASSHEYEWNDGDLITLSARDKQQFRVNDALHIARKYIAQTVEAGLYDGKKSNCSPIH